MFICRSYNIYVLNEIISFYILFSIKICIIHIKTVILQSNSILIKVINTKGNMKFSLSNDSRTLIQQSTGLDYAHQCSTAISNVDSKGHGNSAYKIKDSRDVAPRGSIYLQMGRIMSLHKVKSYLKRI